MFAVPDAKRIKRSDIFRHDEGSQVSRASTRSTSPAESMGDEEENTVRPTYGFEYDFIAPKSSSPKPALASSKSQPVVDLQEEEQEYQFRLFMPTSKSTVQPSQPSPTIADSRIRLSQTPEPAALADSLSLDKAHFLRPNRPDSYYFTSALPEETVEALKSQYADVALSTSDVLSRAKSTKWPGTALPWRLIHVEVLDKGRRLNDVVQPARSGSNTRNSESQRPKSSSKRPSKKRRILLRRRLALRQELSAQARATEEMEQEKRTRRNREKKVKRKEREKRKKLEAPLGEGKPAGNGEGEGDVSSYGGEATLGEERNPKTGGDVKPNSIQNGGVRSEKGLVSLNKPPDSTSASKSSAPTRRAPTCSAPTAAAFSTTTVNPRTPKPVHPTRLRP